MGTYIALLRGVNVGGHKQVSMAGLRELLTSLGFENPRSLLQSGNLVFSTRKRPSRSLEDELETETEKHLGLQTRYFIRTAEEWKAIIAANPFPGKARSDPSHLIVMPLREAPKGADVKALQNAITGEERLRVVGTEAYITYPEGIGTSKLTLARIESRLHTNGTGRNWNTALKLASLASS